MWHPTRSRSFNPGGWFRAVYAGDRPVGFVMLFNPTFRRLLSSYVPGADGPEEFYLSNDFIKPGRYWDNGTETEIALWL
jgi:hypothetical protein